MIHSHELGEYLKKQRKAKGLKPKDLVCEDLSEATVRRIERGERVRPEKLRLYCQRAGIPFGQYLRLIGQDDSDRIQQRLEDIDFDLELRLDPDQCLKELNEIKNSIDPDHPCLPFLYFLKAKGYFYTGKLNKAERAAREAIDAANKQDGNQNIAAVAQNILGNICFYTRSLQDALDETDKSIEYFEQAIERFGTSFRYYTRYYMALLNKASYLEKLHRYRDAEETLDFLVSESHNIERADLKATVFEIQARVKWHNQRHMEAITYANKGLDIVTENRLYDRAADLWIVVGNIREDLDQTEEAKRAYQQALKMKDFIISDTDTKETADRKKAVIAKAYTCLADLHRRRLRDFETAKALFNKALELESEDSRFVDTYIGVAKLFLDLGKKDAAIRPLQKALELAQNKGIAKKEKEIAGLLADCFEDIDDEQHIFYLKHYRKVGRNLQRGNQ